MTTSIVRRVELTEFEFEVKNLSISGSGMTIVCNQGSSIQARRSAVKIETDDGLCGEYVTNWGGLKGSYAQAQMLCPHLIGRDAESREEIYDDFKREIRQLDHFGHGPLDIALWDLAGKKYNTSVGKLLGAYRKKLVTYASTYHGDDNGELHCPEAFANFAEQCYEMGYRYFKIHGWNNGDAKREARNVLHVAEKVGDRMGLMLDPACELRTFNDTLYVGKACDEGNYIWYEDPFRDGGTSAFAHNKLRSMIKTPLLITEHVRGLEPKADFVLAGGTDILRADPEYDMGITGTMKTAHLAESLGLDIELHAPGPAQRQCMAAIRNTNYYELALVGPKSPNVIAPVYTCGYSDQLDAIDSDGCVPVPDGPGLGVSYDWDYIEANKTDQVIFE
ncbi:MAG: mandelate racemase [Lentisphaeria bacterium]|nr:mandelate racemase [Lentisphaeria bacterium]